MGSVEQSIDLDVPVKTAYDQWTQFEDFPKFMKGVKEIRQIDDTHLHWKAEIAGHVKEWDAEITEQPPDERVAWKATDGPPAIGVRIARGPGACGWVPGGCNPATVTTATPPT